MVRGKLIGFALALSLSETLVAQTALTRDSIDANGDGFIDRAHHADRNNDGRADEFSGLDPQPCGIWGAAVLLTSALCSVCAGG